VVIKQSRLILQFPPAGKSAGRVHYEKTKRKHNIYTSHTHHQDGESWLCRATLHLSHPWGCALGHPARQASALVREGSTYCDERKKEKKNERKNK